ncbi:N-acetylglucosamine kinase [Pedobacter montanisoli]|uniref:N-acetylglucosamine kinase n=1 Tax=Pedobacter montanisoli TaxID=2923277 RepID=A0ABS9ZS83_9SPHI|nr:N-acetylglucosamine kinase [Pedobacter montanisoli]MCJ0741430.1 N-acetylglucosamine kinase [Pedobacter montanisoli]
MILVADSGSSKTDWIAHNSKETLDFHTQGINPYFLNSQEIIKILSKNKDLSKIAAEVKEIYFFGAGCSSPDKREVVSNALSSFFKNAYVSVDHDLIGSAYATCGDKKGLSCILGTGSNIAYYDGKDVYPGKHGLGYILGDEGSGTFFGRRVLLSYLYKTMPAELREKFKQTYPVTKDIVIEHIYQKPFPNSYLAAFSKFMAANKSHPFIQNLLKDGFQEFIDSNVKDYKNYRSLECSFVGSIAYYYQDELKAVFAANDIKIGKILQKPVEGIFEYILKREGIGQLQSV